MTLEAATGKTLNHYAEEKLWSKIGPEGDAFLFRSTQATSDVRRFRV